MAIRAFFMFVVSCVGRRREKQASLAVQKVSGHEQLESDLGRNGKVWNLRRAVCVADFVCEIHTDFLKDVRPFSTKIRMNNLV